MNERIKELVFQAGFIGESMNPIIGTSQATALENFAELIIKKCVTIGNYAYDGGEYPGTMIKEYFGVEKLPACKHDWYSARNPVIQNGSICVICGVIDPREPEELNRERTNS